MEVVQYFTNILSHEIKKPPSQPNFYQPEDLEFSNRDELLLECSCANNSFREPEIAIT